MLPAGIALEVSSLRPATIFEVAVLASPRAESVRKVRRVDSGIVSLVRKTITGRIYHRPIEAEPPAKEASVAELPPFSPDHGQRCDANRPSRGCRFGGPR